MNKTVVITGSSRGIGRETAIYFGTHGYNVVVCYRVEEAKASEVVDVINKTSRAIGVKVDVRDKASVANLYREAIKAFGKVDVVVNNAGISRTNLSNLMSEADFTDLVNTNMVGMHNVTNAFIGDMISRKAGAIVNISSIWGVAGGSMEVAYSMTKAGVIGYTKALAREVGMSGIRVNAVAPGVIATDMTANLSTDTMDSLADEIALGRIGKPEDIAPVVYFFASEEASFVTGQVLVVDGGMI